MVIVNRCLKFMQHRACGQNVYGKDAGLIVFSYDPATSRYATLAITADGTGHPGRLEVDGGRWLFPWDEQHGGVTVHLRVVNVFTGPDLVDRDFTASAPNQLWVADITYVPTHAGPLSRGRP